MEQKSLSSHILNTSSNLLGICFLVLTALKLQNLSSTTIIDELTIISMILFMASIIFSFISLKSSGGRFALSLENIADYLFMVGIIILFFTTIIVALNMIS